MGEKNFCLALFFPLQPVVIILILFKGLSLHFEVCEKGQTCLPILITRNTPITAVLADRLVLHQPGPNSCLPTQCPLQPLLCSLATLSGAGCGQAEKRPVSLWKFEMLPSPATNPATARQGRQYLKLPGQILSKDFSNPSENPFCLASPTNVIQPPVPDQEPPAITAWERKLHHKKSPRFT